MRLMISIVLVMMFASFAAGQSPRSAPSKPHNEPAVQKPAPKPHDPEPGATNAGICKDVVQRVDGWRRTILKEEALKTGAEVKLANCKVREKRHETLPGECEVFEGQIEGITSDLKRWEHEANQTRGLLAQYNCPQQ